MKLTGRLLFRFAVSAALLALAFSLIDTGELARIFGSARPGPFIAAIICLVLSTFVCAWRWHIVCRALDLPLTYKTASCEYFGCTFFNHVLPGGVVGDVARAWRHRGPRGLTVAAHSVLAERLLGQSAFILCLALAAPALLLAPELKNRETLALIYGAVVLVFVSLAFLIITGKHLPGAAGRKVEEFHDALYEVGFKTALYMLLVSVLMVACFIGAFYGCAQALQIAAPPVLLLGAVPVLKATMMLPVSVGGWGFREGAAGGLWVTVGLAAAEGVALSVTYGLAFILASLPGIIFWSDWDEKALKR